MRQGCRIIDLNKSKAIMCGGEPTDHKCNEDAVCYDTEEGRFIFKDEGEAKAWYGDNHELVRSFSVACSICGRAAIDNVMWI